MHKFTPRTSSHHRVLGTCDGQREVLHSADNLFMRQEERAGKDHVKQRQIALPEEPHHQCYMRLRKHSMRIVRRPGNDMEPRSNTVISGTFCAARKKRTAAVTAICDGIRTSK